MNITLALVDDHVLLRNGLASHLAVMGFRVLFQASNGQEFITKAAVHQLPQLVLMDINMPVMDGFKTTGWLKEQHPDVKVLALSMYDEEASIIRMLRQGARGYILKDCEPTELKTAIHQVMTNGFYYSDLVTGKLIHSIHQQVWGNADGKHSLLGLADRELAFLKLVCTEMTYKEIADRMCLSPRTIDGYRDALFEKLDIKSRVGLVLFAIKNGLVTV